MKDKYYVYVVLLDDAVLKIKKFTVKSPEYETGLPCYYVGQSNFPPPKRFEKHKRNHKANRFVRDFGIELVPDLYDEYNPLPSRGAAVQKEEEIGIELREAGHPVYWNGSDSNKEINMSESKEETLQKMDEAAELAGVSLSELLENLSNEEMQGAKKVLEWFKNNYMKAGYKRLGKIIKDL